MILSRTRMVMLGFAVMISPAASIQACSSSSSSGPGPADAATELTVVTFDGPTPFDAHPSETGGGDATAPSEAGDDGGVLSDSGNAGDSGDAGSVGDAADM